METGSQNISKSFPCSQPGKLSTVQVSGLFLLVEKSKIFQVLEEAPWNISFRVLSLAVHMRTRLPQVFDSPWDELCPRLGSLAGSLEVSLGKWGRRHSPWVSKADLFQKHTLPTSLPQSFYFRVSRTGSLTQPGMVQRTKKMISVNF